MKKAPTYLIKGTTIMVNLDHLFGEETRDESLCGLIWENTAKSLQISCILEKNHPENLDSFGRSLHLGWQLGQGTMAFRYPVRSSASSPSPSPRQGALSLLVSENANRLDIVGEIMEDEVDDDF